MTLADREIIERLTRIETEASGAHAQAKKTNGRVQTLEERQDNTDKWRSFMTGGLAVLTTLVVPIAITLVLRLV